jgi:hypothetical protein
VDSEGKAEGGTRKVEAKIRKRKSKIKVHRRLSASSVFGFLLWAGRGSKLFNPVQSCSKHRGFSRENEPFDIAQDRLFKVRAQGVRKW